jgi:prepilin-type N-terminal cleavage/methylation domain-containing protein
MAESSQHLKKAFSLIEVLVATSLVAVVGTMAFLILESTRQVAEEVRGIPSRPFEQLTQNIQRELDNLLPRPGTKDLPSFSLDQGMNLTFTTQERDKEGQFQVYAVAYLHEESHTLQIYTRYPDGLAVTNVLNTLSSPLRFEVWTEEMWVEMWPPEEKNRQGVPARIRIGMEGEMEGDRLRELYIPASYGVEKPQLQTKR